MRRASTHYRQGPTPRASAGADQRAAVLHGLGHMVGLDVHDPAQYPAVLAPGMVFTIEPGVYIAEENLGVRIECTFLVGPDGKLIDLNADLPHTAEEVEAAMRAR